MQIVIVTAASLDLQFYLKLVFCLLLLFTFFNWSSPARVVTFLPWHLRLQPGEWDSTWSGLLSGDVVTSWQMPLRCVRPTDKRCRTPYILWMLMLMFCVHVAATAPLFTPGWWIPHFCLSFNFLLCYLKWFKVFPDYLQFTQQIWEFIVAIQVMVWSGGIAVSEVLVELAADEEV